MKASDLLGKYLLDSKTNALATSLQNNQARIQINGHVGSGSVLVALATLKLVGGTHLFILDDKEEAAYFLNDTENLDPNLKPLFLPASYRVPYQEETTDNANVMLRAEVLNRLNRKSEKPQVIFTYPEALSEQVVTKQNLTKNTLEIVSGKEYTLDFIDELLIELEFEKVDYVYEPGQFSVRGGIIDIFSFSNENPFRVEFFGNEVDSIRTFDPVSQLSIKPHKKAVIIPNVQQRMVQENRISFLEYIQDATVWLKDFDLCTKQLEKEIEKGNQAYEKLERKEGRIKVEQLLLHPEAFKKQILNHKTVELSNKGTLAKETITFNQVPQPSINKNFDILNEHFQGYAKDNYTNVIACGNPKQIERVHAIFEDKGFETNFTPIPLELSNGFIDRITKLSCYTDHQIFERYHRFRLKEGFKKSKQALTIKELTQLQPGDFVVHVDHGVGTFSGLEKIDVNGKQQEAIRLIYKDSDILYVSIHSLHRISKFTGKEGTQPKINKLGTQTWANLKSKTKNRVKQIAFDLLQLYAKRKASIGYAYNPDSYLQTELEASFIYEDTPDQLKATQDVKEDMEKQTPMDRLICGDVGFGKTEIAIRAAFKAIADGKQVAIMVPTTVLCLQHYKSFRKRLEDFPCRVEYINRFRSANQVKETLADLKAGKVDIIIGTHKLVSKNVEFKSLGLLIIDEEQKFGVAVKDKLKTFKENIDCLTLSATPIPRTLQFSLMGARDLSIIATPPPNRHPVQTEVTGFNEELIRDAITYEVQRGGQVFFVHNRVQNIKEVAGMISRICPGIRVCVGHGQMDGKQLEAVMVDFTEGAYDVLVATTIIESGIDITNANTIIINQAQNFGLSDLHQLRGRVGRNNKQAFCYLLAPPRHSLPEDARKRLQAIEQFSDLGSGMNIAMRDLDIRGAGDLLGGEQSGFISEIGFETYHKILDEAMKELRENEFKDVFADELAAQQYSVDDCIIETDFEILIPDHYVNNITERLSLYKELDDLKGDESLTAFEKQLQDRFGAIPESTRQLLNTIKLRWLAQEIGFEKLILKNERMLGYFPPQSETKYFQQEQFGLVLQYIQSNPRGVQLKNKNDKLYLSFMDVKSVKDAITKTQTILQKVKAEAS